MPNLRASYEHAATTPRRDRAADEHGLAAQLGIVPLLDRREERVEVDVQDRPSRVIARTGDRERRQDRDAADRDEQQAPQPLRNRR